MNAIRVREFSDFNNYIDCYQAGLNGAIIFSPTQRLNLQVLNNSAAKGEESFIYGLPEVPKG